jgi:predicted nucleic acid-binding protein
MSAAEVQGLFLLDTNIFIYSFDVTAPEKQQQAKLWIEAALRTQRGVISTQVIQEFLNVALRKFAQPMSVSEAREYLRTVLFPMCQHFPSTQFYDRALLLKEETGFSYFDALILTAAAEIGCSTLLTEDLQNGRVVHGVKIMNPFQVPASGVR